MDVLEIQQQKRTGDLSSCTFKPSVWDYEIYWCFTWQRAVKMALKESSAKKEAAAEKRGPLQVVFFLEWRQL